MQDWRDQLKELSPGLGVPDGNYVYVLQCGPPHIDPRTKPHYFSKAVNADLRFYVGYSTNIPNRIKRHVNGEGAVFTEIFPPIKLVSLDRIDKEVKAKAYERRKAQAIRMKYSMENVESGFEGDNNAKKDVYVYQK